MPLKTIGTGRGLMGGGTYADKALGTGPIAYWPLWEASGAVAHCLINPAQDGAYVGVTLGNLIAPDGSLCPLFDGVNDYVNASSAAFSAAFNGSEGSVMGWGRVFNVGVWTDGLYHAIWRLTTGTSTITIGKSNVNNQAYGIYVAGGVTETVLINGLTTTDWMQFVLTWSASADQVKFYYNGAQTGATQTVLGVWGGAISANNPVIGANTVTPTVPWYGWISHVAVWARAIAPSTVAALYATL